MKKCPIKIVNDYSKQVISLASYEYKFLDKITMNDNNIMIVSCAWYKDSEPIKISKNHKNMIILANTEEEKEYYETVVDNKNCEVLYCNRNCLIDENIFNIDTKMEKKYDMIINSAFSEYKNTKVANLCQNVAHVGYIQYHKIFLPTFGTILNNKKGNTFEKILRPDLIKILNQSKVGGIFSVEEGQCRASSEYLLTGLPVISVKSKGGRDVFYNDYNSIICENDPVSVFNCVDLAKQRLIDGTFNAENIRNDHLEMTYGLRKTLLDCLKEKLPDDVINETTLINQLKI